MPDIFNQAGDNVATIPLSEKQLTTMATGADIVVIFHTPQLLRGVLGERNGSFTLRRIHERIETDQPDAVKQYAELQKAVQAARGGG